MSSNISFSASCYSSVGACFLLSVVYVASLYVWSSSQSRDHPSTIKRRFLSVFIMMFISPIFLYTFSSEELFVIGGGRRTLWQLLGLRSEGLVAAITIPLLLTMVLFLGPLFMSYNRTTYPSTSSNNSNGKNYNIVGGGGGSYLSNLTDLIWLRNHIVAPLSEEFTFRACMLPLLLQCFESTPAILICPLFFGVAHFHHMLERLNTGMDVKTAVFISSFQFLYTTLFGIYSAYLFARTGHFLAPFVAHAFCNHMGFPNFQEALQYEKPRKNITCALFVAGLVSWCLLLHPLTTPSLYGNTLHENKS